MDKCSMLSLPKLILASGSPRRAEILTSVGWGFTKDSADIDETALPNELPEDYVQRLALEKAYAVARKYDDAIILGADTTVVINRQIIGKPVDLADAKRMLKMLSGNWHEVLTGVAIVKSMLPAMADKQNAGFIKHVVGIQKTRVKFTEMSDEEIEFLAEKGEPLDKAGAYAVQAQAALFIEGIEGDYWNVVGLPVSLVYGLIQDLARHG